MPSSTCKAGLVSLKMGKTLDKGKVGLGTNILEFDSSRSLRVKILMWITYDPCSVFLVIEKI